MGTSGDVHFDDDVVDAGADERGEQMLDGLDRRGAVRERRGQLNPTKVRHVRWNLEATEVHTPEPDARIRLAWLEGKRDFLTGMEADACT